MVSVAAGAEAVCPYPYQCRLADEGLPDVLRAPTGSGKTLAAVLPWLYRRMYHNDGAVRESTPHWLVVVLPQRALVEQTSEVVRGWIANLGADVGVHVLMGGEDSDRDEWVMGPARTRVFVGTQDMVLSRLLMRGFAESRAAWPVSFGLLNAGVQFVFDEVQLMGAGLATSLQLQGFRESIGTAAPCRSMWMSATLDPAVLRSVDFDRRLQVRELGDADRVGALRTRLDAVRTVRRMDLGIDDAKRYAASLAGHVVAEHRAGTRTLVVLNTVGRAVAVFEALKASAGEAKVVLLHSRFRPNDRAEHMIAATAVDPGTAGTIVVSTQVLEAGVDITSATLITELAPWPSIVQRAGRCNRYGETSDARLLWLMPVDGKPELPYEPADLVSAADALTGLEGAAVTGTQLGERSVATVPVVHPVLRRRDLLDLFDTAPDLSGHDIDVSPYIRDVVDRTVSVVWREIDGLDAAAATTGRAAAIARSELCSAPIGDVTGMIRKGHTRARVWDQEHGAWRAARAEDVRPTAVVVLDAARGGYRSDIGFDPTGKTPVAPVEVSVTREPDAYETDPLSGSASRWVPLAEHLGDTEWQAQRIADEYGDTLTLAAGVVEAIVVASALHDIGKAHSVFQASLHAANPDAPAPECGQLWGKSPSGRQLRHNPPGFRHELAGALMLLDAGAELLEQVGEAELVVYLVLAHHGKVRLAVRARDDENRDTTLGITDGDLTPEFVLPDGRVMPGARLSLRHTRHGVGTLTDRALSLRDRSDIGAFRLAFCEAVVRSADWRATVGGRELPCRN